ncbi:excisionase family DNA-binding protein [Turicibacter sanguinis]|jgi:DNA binding domain, excisionase family|uniref:excisionase family DNA-binding protein n=1 Tax=Turicibacter TaxID=191303 RepID=UPI0001FD99FE|nr:MULTISPECIES: excisionase family DNA-binding protein [Turicibacter]EGC92653.1 DNA binding domain protein, excisionase family [Turicibacter sp. HGF1]MDB8556734.1 excisionase family DNA-binding protein [Turicibacter sanguinis]MDB8564277.1 excisionase family DNA-binding protein [Turicibacter sanguinis]
MAKVEVAVKDKKLITLDEAAALLNTSVPTVRKLANVGLIPFLRLGTGIRIKMIDLDGFCEGLTYKKFDLDTLEIIDLLPTDISA